MTDQHEPHEQPLQPLPGEQERPGPGTPLGEPIETQAAREEGPAEHHPDDSPPDAAADASEQVRPDGHHPDDSPNDPLIQPTNGG